MLNGSALSLSYAAMAIFALAGWLLSLVKRDVSIVDSLWSLFFLLGFGVYVAASAESPRTGLLIALVSLWALRLSIYLTWRNWGEPEDHRYQVIRARNEPNFSVKSVYLIFGFQVVLAGIIAFPLFTAASSTAPLGPLDWVGVALWLLGMFFEVVGDWQLARFKSNPAQKGRVLNTGLWRYTRHPNYFGETALWWGYYAIALSAGAWWTIFAPLLMTLLLLKVSGVALLEKDIGERRPAYADYVRRTNAFLPWLPKDAS
jgi:steroid 5-alpha reductase family enzyme